MDFGDYIANQRYEDSSFENGSTVAAPKVDEGNSVVNKVISNQDNIRQYRWFNSGVRAHKRGYEDFSPFYENATADYFFKCGYDGATFEQAQEVLTENIKNFLEKDSTVLETVNELGQHVLSVDPAK